MGFNTIEQALDDIKAGNIVIVVDDEDRENEGDFIMASEHATPQAINFMAKYGRGLICVSVTDKRAKDLNLNPMVQNNTAELATAFTVSVDHLPSNTTGISAADRANTVQAIVDDTTKPSDLGRPGHIFPLIAKNGGVLRRAGHTEAASDLAYLAGLKPSGVLCEIMNDDGTMARVPELLELAEQHNLKIITIQDLIEYRKNKELFVEKTAGAQLPTQFGNFQIYTFQNKHNPQEQHTALVMGDVTDGDPVLVRMHSECLTGDVFGSLRCDCGNQLDAALALIARERRGVLVYLKQEGRGIGLPAKIRAYALQEKGYDTVEANHKLGYKADLREYGFGAQVLSLLGVKKIKLLTNNPRKIVGLKGYDLEVVERVPLQIKSHDHNRDYLAAKRDKLGHMFERPPLPR